MDRLREFRASGYRSGGLLGDGRVAKLGAAIAPYVPPINYITLHYAYFILASLVFGAIFWGTSSPVSTPIGFVDSLFLAMSAMTSAGLNTVNVSQMSTGQQAVLVILMLLGSPVLISVQTLWFRRHVFKKRFRAIVKAEEDRKRKETATGTAIGVAGALTGLLVMSQFRSPKSREKSGTTQMLSGLGSLMVPNVAGGPSSSASAAPRKGAGALSSRFSGRPDRLGEEPDLEAGMSTGLAPHPAHPASPSVRSIASRKQPHTPGLGPHPTPPSSPGARSIASHERPQTPGLGLHQAPPASPGARSFTFREQAPTPAVDAPSTPPSRHGTGGTTSHEQPRTPPLGSRSTPVREQSRTPPLGSRRSRSPSPVVKNITFYEQLSAPRPIIISAPPESPSPEGIIFHEQPPTPTPGPGANLGPSTSPVARNVTFHEQPPTPPPGSHQEPPASPGARSMAFHEQPPTPELHHLAPPPSSGARSMDFLAPPRLTPSHNHNGLLSPTGSSISGQSGPGFNMRTFLEENKENIGRNGQFFNLTHEDREYLGGLEYRALEVLIATVTIYFFLLQLLGAIALGAWMAVNAADITAVNAQNPWWAGAFLAVSAFTNGGMTLLDIGLIAFQSGYYFILIVTAFLMFAGGVAFPIFLRLVMWILSKTIKYWANPANYGVWHETFHFILHYPRRVYTMLFPARPTWLLVAMLLALTIINWIMIHLLSIGNPTLDAIPTGIRVFDALFQSISILSGGFAVVAPSGLYFGVQVLWVGIMYLSAYPGAITTRNSNVYEERSLGIYAEDETPASDENEDGDTPGMETNNVRINVPNNNSRPDRAPQRNDPAPEALQVPLAQYRTGNSQMSTLSKLTSRRELKKAIDIGKQGTAFVGRTIQRRLTGFNGIGAPPPSRRPAGTRRSGGSTFNGKEMGSGGSTGGSTMSHVSYHGNEKPMGGPTDLVSHHVRSQLSHDVWWIALALFIITIIETSHSLSDPATFSVFNIMFEVVSGYANNGISIGVPWAAFSFSGAWQTGSKLILFLVMLRGRHRGLPVALDRAVRLPGLDLDQKEEEDEEIRRTLSRATQLSRNSHLSRTHSRNS
ncbi:cation transport protein-domain-containing protein [Lasiosphaeria miniovina]|uniref:Cation transport protein-domain-containing protein n=1 Tax=Lasiosphaeria miniovina TaxID=1954250 RepID=A0AA40AV82_9PEZI|nr:cation transport protein-domain-containing protein [Lasiosphaeria miniovina]KAK0722573.1 cation transport protein-domain-containing protein [Lasiosphaeria miniovina]